VNWHKWVMIVTAGVSAFATVALLGWAGLVAVAFGLIGFTVAFLMSR
jgi:hypothetical protein